MFVFGKEQLVSASPYFKTSTCIRFQDVDAAGFLFFARAFDIFHDAWLCFLKQHNIFLDDILRQQTWAAPLRHAQADYLRPLVFNEEVAVSLTCFHLAAQEITLGWQIVNQAGELAAVAQTVHTFIAPKTRTRIAVPEAITALFPLFDRE